MSLRFFHILFIALAAVLAVGIGVRGLYLGYGSLNGGNALVDLLWILGGVVLAGYDVWYARKTRGQSLI